MKTVYMNNNAKLQQYRRMADNLMEILESGLDAEEKVDTARQVIEEEVERDEKTRGDDCRTR